MKLRFEKKCNTQKQYKKTGEEAIYSYCLIKDVILRKFIGYIFEDNNEGFISGCKIIQMIEQILN